MEGSILRFTSASKEMLILKSV